MIILFIANHGCGDNDDEGAVAYALEKLGHTVIKIHEKRRHRSSGEQYLLQHSPADMCLFFKHPVVSEIAELSERMPCVFWYFDMVRSVVGDPTLFARSQSRIAWMNDVLPYVTVGFCTDGDWVHDHGDPKLVHLMQGMDERVAGMCEDHGMGLVPPILFMGMRNHGQARANHLAHLETRYGNDFLVLGDGGPKFRKHGRDLAQLLASTKIVVAPNGPNTDRYWSNRVYLTTGLGGFLIHPYCAGLAEQYAPGEELTFYTSETECDALIDCFLEDDKERERRKLAGHKATMERHLYRHRCEELLAYVAERTISAT